MKALKFKTLLIISGLLLIGTTAQSANINPVSSESTIGYTNDNTLRGEGRWKVLVEIITETLGCDKEDVKMEARFIQDLRYACYNNGL